MVLDGPNWWTEGSDACPLICGYVSSVCASSKVKDVIFVIGYHIVHMF